MTINLRQLTAFTAIAKLGSFTRAASHLHLSQPALTVQIRELESALGVRLLDRNTRAVALTQVGKQLLPSLDRVMAELNGVLHNTRELSALNHGVVTVAALPSISATLLPSAIAKFRQRYAGIRVKLVDNVALRIVALVKSEEVDFGISSLPQLDPDIRMTPLLSDTMVALFPAGHALKRRRNIALRELLGFPLILMDSASSVRSLLNRAAETIDTALAPAYEVTYISTAISMVRAGLGITVLPSSAIEFESARGLCARTLSDASLTRTIGILEKKGRSLSPAAASFIETVKTLPEFRHGAHTARKRADR